MKVFISWSGAETKQFALFLHEWLQTVIQSVKPWMSEKDITKGRLSMAQLGAELEGTKFGIVVLTTANQKSQWINFEAGAISKSAGESSVIPLLMDLTKTDVVGPLSQFQAVDATDKAEVLQLLEAINSSLSDPLPAVLLQHAAEREWPRFEAKVAEFRDAVRERVPGQVEQRDERDMLDEILLLVRDIRREDSLNPRLDYKQQVHIENGPVHLYLNSPEGTDMIQPDNEPQDKE